MNGDRVLIRSSWHLAHNSPEYSMISEYQKIYHLKYLFVTFGAKHESKASNVALAGDGCTCEEIVVGPELLHDLQRACA